MFNFIEKLICHCRLLVTGSAYKNIPESQGEKDRRELQNEKDLREFREMIQRDRRLYGIPKSVGTESLKYFKDIPESQDE